MKINLFYSTSCAVKHLFVIIYCNYASIRLYYVPVRGFLQLPPIPLHLHILNFFKRKHGSIF